MLYCQFSTENYHSDVHVSSDITGAYGIEVAEKRRVTGADSAHRWVPIHGPCDGEVFAYTDPRPAIAQLIRLREQGYRVPQSCLQKLRAEATGLGLLAA